MKTNEEVADGIIDAMNAAGGGTEGWERLEYQGDERYLGLSAIAEVARIVERLIRNGDASPEMVLAAREALLDQELEDERLPDTEEDAPSVEDRVLAGETDAGVVAAMIAGAHEGERFRVTDAAAQILADYVRDDVIQLTSYDLAAIREALRLDHATPI
jgi:hypothetical protein